MIVSNKQTTASKTAVVFNKDRNGHGQNVQKIAKNRV